jgi:hypothetical protein
VHTAGEDDTGDTQRNTGKNAGDKDKDKWERWNEEVRLDAKRWKQQGRKIMLN